MIKNYKTIKKGDKFLDADIIEEFIEPFEVIEVVENKNGGKPVSDMLGFDVWNEPKYFVKAKSLKTNRVLEYPLQGDNDNFAGWMTFFDTEEDMRKKIYESRKERYCHKLKNYLSDFNKSVKDLPLYEDCMDDDMKEIVNMVQALKTKLNK